jgi:SAM-dependent methyltransferase
MSRAVTSFDPVVDAYEAARPSYPDGVFDALGPLTGRRVIDCGAGTGIATRALRARGADVLAVDIGEQMLRRNEGVRFVADAARSPLRDGCADLVCFAQVWHWLDHAVANPEMARLLVDGGRWAGWWNHARADGQPWFEAYWDILEARTDAFRWHRDTDWGATIDRTLFAAPVFTAVPWTREVSVESWLTDQRSHSYIGLTAGGDDVMGDLERVLRDEFGDGPVRVRYETWLWVATKR